MQRQFKFEKFIQPIQLQMLKKRVQKPNKKMDKMYKKMMEKEKLRLKKEHFKKMQKMQVP